MVFKSGHSFNPSTAAALKKSAVILTNAFKKVSFYSPRGQKIVQRAMFQSHSK